MSREIDVWGKDLESVVHLLLDAKAKGESVYCNFNGHKLYSDTISMDSAFMEVMGKTKEEADKELRQIQESLQAMRQQNGILNWVKKGQALIFPERYDEWKVCVIDCAFAGYGPLLDVALEIMQALENGATIEEASKMFIEQNHSASTESIVTKIIFNFSKKGPEFCEAIAYRGICSESKQKIEEKKSENFQLTQANSQIASGSKSF